MLRKMRVLAVVGLVAALAAGCGSEQGSGGGTSEAPKGDKIGVVVLTSGHPFYQSYQKHWQKLAADNNLDLTLLDSDTKVEKQQQNFDDLLNKQVKGIVISPVDAASATPLVKQAEGQGVKIATVAVQVEGAPVVIEGAYQAGFQGGVAAAEWIKENRPNWKIKMAIVTIPQLQQTVDRANGFIAGVQSVAKNAEVVTQQDGGSVLDKATTTAENMLQAHPEANLWYGVNDDSALGALNALKAAGRGTNKTELLVGFDGSAGALKELLDKDSALKVEIGNLPFSYAQTALKVIQDSIAGKQVPEANPVPVKILTDQTPEAEIRTYYETEYGGTLE